MCYYEFRCFFVSGKNQTISVISLALSTNNDTFENDKLKKKNKIKNKKKIKKLV
jgi:hypothetical protein